MTKRTSPTWRGSYGLRWVLHAWESTRAFFGLHVREFLLTILGPSLGFFLLSVVTGSSTVGEAFIEWRWLAYGAVGTVIVLLATFTLQLLLAPSGMEAAARRNARASEMRRAGASEAREVALTTELEQARADVVALRRRLENGELHLEVAHEGPNLLAIDCTPSLREAFIESERARYSQGLQRWKRNQEARRSSLYPTLVSPADRDTRDPNEFVREVESYLSLLATHWHSFVRHAVIDQQVTALHVVVHNPTERAFGSVQIEIHLPADAGVGWSDDPEWSQDVPTPPDEWGSHTIYAGIGSIPSVLRTDPGTIERVGDTLIVSFDPFDLRPRARVSLARLWMFVPDSYAGSAMAIDWEAASAAASVIGRDTGTLSISVAPSPVSPITPIHAAHSIRP